MLDKRIDDGKTQAPKYTVDIHNIQPLSETEAGRNISIPFFRFGPKDGLFNEEVISESNRVASLVMSYLRVPSDIYKNRISPFNLLDMDERNEQGASTFPRTELGVKYSDIPVIIYTLFPILDSSGNHSMAMCDPGNNVIALSINQLEGQLTQTYSRAITKPGDVILKSEVLDHPEIVAGITMIEEMTHFVQFQIWGEKSTDGTNSVQTIEEHDADPMEAEARIIKNQLIKLIYPEYILREVEPDRRTELKYEVEEACSVALLPDTERKNKFTAVYVENMKDFPTLVELTLRQILISNYGLSDEELDGEYKEFYKEWFETNTRHHLNYAEQQANQMEQESLRAMQIGMEFTKNEEGKINAHPYIAVNQEVTKNIK